MVLQGLTERAVSSKNGFLITNTLKDLHSRSFDDTSSPVCFALRGKPETDGSKWITKWVEKIDCVDLPKFKYTKRFDNKDEYSYTALVGDACLMEGWMCDDNAHCINNGTASFVCRCNDGYSGTGFTCEEVFHKTAVTTELRSDTLINAKSSFVPTSNLTLVTETTDIHSTITYDISSDLSRTNVATRNDQTVDKTLNFGSSEIHSSTETTSTTLDGNAITTLDTTTSGLISTAATTLTSTQIVTTKTTRAPCLNTLTDCSGEKTRSSHYGNSSYCIGDISISWYCAKEQCQVLNQSLAVVDDEGESKHLSTETNKDTLWTKWIELYTVNENKIWVSEGRNATYLNWNGGHPWVDAEYPMCGLIRGGADGLFHSAYCHSDAGFICETTNTTAL